MNVTLVRAPLFSAWYLTPEGTVGPVIMVLGVAMMPAGSTPYEIARYEGVTSGGQHRSGPLRRVRGY